MSDPDYNALLRTGCGTDYGTLVLNSVAMQNPYGAWCTPDLSPLWGSPEVRGSDVLLPGAVGVRAFGRRGTVTTHNLRFIVSGQVDGQSGDLPEDHSRTPEAQLAVNMAYLHAQVFTSQIITGTWTPPGVGAINASVRARLPSTNIALLPKAILRGTILLDDPHYALHL